MKFNMINSKPDIQHLACECGGAGQERSVTVKFGMPLHTDLSFASLDCISSHTHLDVRQLDLTLCRHMLPPVTRLY
jgi:hypothetical protein